MTERQLPPNEVYVSVYSSGNVDNCGLTSNDFEILPGTTIYRYVLAGDVEDSVTPETAEELYDYCYDELIPAADGIARIEARDKAVALRAKRAVLLELHELMVDREDRCARTAYAALMNLSFKYGAMAEVDGVATIGEFESRKE